MSIRTLTSLALAAATIAVPASAQVLTRKDLSLALAKTIAEGALADCGARTYAVSSVVVNRAGETIVALRADDASPAAMENARRKAYTAMAYKQNTTEYAKKFADHNPTVMQQVTLPNVIAIGGGVPIRAGNDIIGGIGISGSPGVDEACALAGIAKVADQLK